MDGLRAAFGDDWLESEHEVLDSDFAALLDADFDADCADADEIDPATWNDRGVVQRTVECMVETFEQYV